MKKIIVFLLSLFSMLLFNRCIKLEDIGGNDATSNENWKFAYAENYVDGMDAIFCRDGYTALFGFQDVDLYSNTQTGSRVICVVKTDFESGKVDLDDATVIIVDSTYFPVQIANKETNIVLTRTDDNHFNCASYNFDSDTWEKHNDIEFDLSTCVRPITRSLSSDGYSIFNLANALQVLSISSNIGKLLYPLNIAERISGGIGLLGDAAPFVEDIPIFNYISADELGLAIGVTLAGNLAGACLAVLAYAAVKIDKFVVAELGKVQISIEVINQINANSCNISYLVSGLNDNGMNNSCLYLEIFSYKDLKTVRKMLPSQNGHNTITVNDLKPGLHGAFLGLYSTNYPIINYRTDPLVCFSVYDVELDGYEIENNPLYENGAVNFKMNIFIKGNEDSLKDIQQYGCYIKYANAIDYKEAREANHLT